MKIRHRRFATAMLIALAALCLSSNRLEARLGGDITVCEIEVRDDESKQESTLAMTANEIAIGSEGKELCKSFFLLVIQAIDTGVIQGYPAFHGGDGRSIDRPVEVDDVAKFANPMALLFAYIQSQQIGGRYTGFKLISRAHDRYAFSMSLGKEGEIATYFLDCSAWMARKLASQ